MREGPQLDPIFAVADGSLLIRIVAQPFLAVLLGFSFSCFVIPTGMADFLFRAALWRVGHGAEGPRQHFNPISINESSRLFGVRWLCHRFYVFNSTTQLSPRPQSHKTVILKPSDQGG